MWDNLVRVFGDMLCTIGVHHCPEELRRWTEIGWFARCTRCGAKCSGLHGGVR